MGLLDKIKNALFEVEYVEVEEPPKKEKKVREEKEEKPIAKKVVLPGKKEEKVEELHEEELKDEDFEIRPKEEPLKVRTREEFKIMNDNDFKVEDEYDVSEPEIVQVIEPEQSNSFSREERFSFKPEQETREVYVDRVESSYKEPVKESKPYGVDNSYNVPMHPYGTYEKKEEKSYFRPSPIISPIYGVLDKNYKKEDVREKRDIRISSYTRENVSVDDVRNKAYGEEKKATVVKGKEETTKFEVEKKEEPEEENVLVDLSDRAKPEVKEITMGDAVEYFQDLGLEYNVDYVDTSTDRNVAKKDVPSEELNTKKEESKLKKEEPEELELTKDLENTMDLGSTEKVTETREEVRRKKEDTVGDDTNDNLFDLIDSMYQEND